MDKNRNKIYFLLIFTNILWLVSTYGSDFPIDEFYGLKGSDADVLRQNISWTHLCHGSQADRDCCYCDDVCFKFKDCCIDRLWRKDSADMQQYIEYFETQVRLSKDTECLPIVSSVSDGDTSEEIRMVNRCPEEMHSSELSKLCSDPDLPILPVFGNDKYVYKNSYCAICNRVQSFQLVNITAQCKNKVADGVSNLLLLRNCTYLARVSVENSLFIRKCNVNREVKRTCKDEQKHDNFGSFYMGAVTTNDGTEYANIHILNCSGNFRPKFTVQCHAYVPTIIPLRYSLLISFRKHTQVTIKDGSKFVASNTPKCADNSVYDVIHRKCQPFVCSLGYQQMDGVCVKSVSSISNSTDAGGIVSKEKLFHHCISNGDASVVLKIESPIGTWNDSDPLLRYVRANIYENLSIDKFPYIVIPETVIIERKKTVEQVIQEFLKYNGDSYSAIGSRIGEVSYVSTVPTVTQLYGANPIHYFPNSKICANPIVHSTVHTFLDSKCSMSLKGKRYSRDELVLFSKQKAGAKELKFVVTCSEFHTALSCPLRVHKNFTIHSNKSISVHIGNNSILHTVSQYTPLRSGVGVCIHTGGKVEHVAAWEGTVWKLEYYLTLAGAVVSIICHIMIILTYCYFSELRTVPGRNIVALCSALMLSDVFIVATVAVDTVADACRVVAVILHWLFLVALTWSTVISFEIWSTFRNQVVKRRVTSYKRFLYYSLYAFIVPTLLVGVAAVLSERAVLPMGYGEHNICWITNMHGRIGFSIVPFGIGMVFNCFILVTTIFRIYRQRQKSAKLLTKTDSNDSRLAWTALKLMVLLGIVELIGFVQFRDTEEHNDVPNAVVAVLYTFLRGFRGFFIWLLYVCRDRRIRDLYRNSKLSSTVISRSSPRTSSTVASRAMSIKNTNIERADSIATGTEVTL